MIKHLTFIKIQNMMDISVECRLTTIVYNFLIKTHWYFYSHTKGINFENQLLVEELHKPIIRKIKKRKGYSSLMKYAIKK